MTTNKCGTIARMDKRDRLIAFWLLTVAAMVWGMVILGGLTRLTHSGLSMVEWRPLTGWLPPLSHADWQKEFLAYQQFPEFRLLNPDMTLAQFQGIYWLEFVHRLWGRLIGVAFFVPFLVFLARGWVRGRLAAGYAALFVLGALQGVLGWYMVKSGLADRPDVSAYRLTAHFALALLLLGALIWTALALRYPPERGGPVGRFARTPLALATLIFVTLCSGGFVAGTDAGFHYNTFPLMDGRLVPEDLFILTPAWRNFLENIPLVQFVHRALAMITLVAVLGFRISHGRDLRLARRRVVLNGLALAVLAQVGLGIATLLLHMPTAIAAWHQANGVLVWGVALWAVFELRRDDAVLTPVADVAAAATPIDNSIRAA